MARKANYGFVKRQKELERQKKKEEKLAKKRLKQESQNADDQSTVAEDGDVIEGSADRGPDDGKEPTP